MVQHADIDHTGLPGITAGGALVDFAISRYTAGTVAVTSTTVGAALASVSNAIVSATAGDLCLIGVHTRCTDTDSASMRLDVGTIVSAAVVNYLSSLSGTADSLGTPWWFVRSSQAEIVSGSVPYVVQAGDISAGNVEFSIRAWLSAADSRPLQNPIVLSVLNFGQ